MAEEGHLSSVNETIELTRKLTSESPPVTSFTGIGSGGGGEARVLAVRAGIGFGEVAGICIVTAALPGAAPGTLSIQQSVDGLNWDQIDSFAMTLVGGVVTFAIKIFGRYVRAVFTVPAGEEYSIRFGGQLKPHTSP
jgi:hypothetical protein